MFSDKTPVQSGKVELRAKGDSTRPLRGVGTIGSDGRFALKTDDQTEGLPAGEYDAVVVQFIVTEERSLSEHQHGRSVPRRYADYYTSGLQVTIPPEGDTKIALIVQPQ